MSADPVVSTGSRVSFNGDQAHLVCAADETILLAGLRAGLGLSYECASGGCGSCKARLVEGRVVSRWEEATGLTDRDRRRGDRILMCQSVPHGEVALRVPAGLEPHAEPVPFRQVGRLAARSRLTADTALFRVELHGPLEHLAGQFVHLEFPDGVRRAYSMTHPPRGGDDIELLVRANPGGQASDWLFRRLAPGAEVVVEGPYGRAYAQTPNDGRPVVLLAGGTGLAPALAIATHLMTQQPDRELTLYVGARTPGDLVPTDRLLELREAGARVCLSADRVGVAGATSEEHPELGSVHLGFPLERLVAEHSDLSRTDVYLGGPTPMVEAAQRALVREGNARADRVFVDRFT